ncbi:MAG: hypothetical protein ACXAC5_09165 [Promethearchaeota archaeon]|jgi:hypothetical protein
MVKIFVCKECGYTFPSELSNLINNHIQVYCESCGSPFNIEGIKFKPAPTPVTKKFPHTIPAISEKESSNLDKIIQFLNKISFLPLFFFTFISFGLIAEIAFNLDSWNFILINRFLPGLIGLLILVYDRAYIAPKIKEKKYNEILLDSFCWGILGCVLYGTGVIMLIKGVFIFIYVIINRENNNLKAYDYGLLAKNSVNYFSSKAGFVIILIGIFKVFSNETYIPVEDPITIMFPFYLEIPIILIVYLIFLIISSVALLIDKSSRSSIGIKQTFEIGDSIKIIIIGVMGVLFYAAGIFILLKGVLLFFLFVTKPSEISHITSIEEKTPPTLQIYRGIESPLKSDSEGKEEPLSEPVRKPLKTEIISKEKESLAIEDKIEQKIEKVEDSEEIPEKEEKEKKIEDIELRLHESLLPVKDEKDKKLVKEYFSKIFAVLSKDLRGQIISLKISKKEKRELLEELAFLSKEEQVRYIEAIIDLYREIPKKLIERIRRLPNVNPKHLDKIVEQLRVMDVEEQLKFVQFLEENA